MAEAKATISFGFSKKTEVPKLKESKLRDDSTKIKEEATDFVISLEDKQVNGTKRKESKKEIVIPLISNKPWLVPRTEQKPALQEDSNIDALAAKEILEETKRIAENSDGPAGKSSNLEIPLYMLKKAGSQVEDKIDTSSHPEEQTLDDYETIPVEEFGMAMLRGMGWKPNEGIGLKNKGVIAPVQAALRPKGLGLGADLARLERASKPTAQSKDEEKLEVKKGAYVQVISGKQTGLYGQIESLDENNGRAFVRMAVGGQVQSISELCLKPVTQKEFKDSSRVLNKDKYDEYKVKQEKEQKIKEENQAQEKRSKKKKKHRSRSHSRSRSRSRDRESLKSKPKQRLDKDHGKKDKFSGNKREKATNSWLHPHLRVRCVDSKFRSGKHYKQKMIVIDVMSQTHCSCKTEDGVYLDSVEISMLETVIPRTDPAHVMVVAGKRRGQICRVVERDRENCIAAVETLPDRDEIFKISYDDICEYTGEI